MLRRYTSLTMEQQDLGDKVIEIAEKFWKKHGRDIDETKKDFILLFILNNFQYDEKDYSKMLTDEIPDVTVKDLCNYGYTVYYVEKFILK